MRRSVVLDTTLRLVLHSALVLSLYLLFAGHNQAGGGFVGGLVAGAAIALGYVAGGMDDVRRIIPLRAWFVLAAGLTLAAGTALAAVLLAAGPLDHAKLEADVPLLGTVKASSALIFDSGVYLVVIGLMLMVFEALGDDPAPFPPSETSSSDAPDSEQAT